MRIFHLSCRYLHVDILDLEDKSSTKVTQLTGAVFSGFSDEQIEGVQRPLELKDNKRKAKLELVE